MIIDKNKPLPPHTFLDYDECCAKLILEELFPERYSALKLADKPDLQGQNIGIEVTCANDQKMQEALENWIKANSCSSEDEKTRCIERMAQLGVDYTGGFQVWPVFIPTFELTKKAVDRKISKIKTGNYKPFPSFELFVFTDTLFHKTVIEEAKQYFFSGFIKEVLQRVYVLSEGADLHLFDIENRNHRNIIIDNAEQTNRNIRARQMVEKAEEELPL